MKPVFAVRIGKVEAGPRAQTSKCGGKPHIFLINNHMKILIILLAIIYSSVAMAQDKILTSSDIGQAVIYVKENSGGEKYLRYEGLFIPYSGAAISNLLTINDDIKYVEFHSPGGLLSEIGETGILMRSRDILFTVREGDVCISACAYLALYSTRIQLDGVLAFHLPYLTGFTNEKTLYYISQSSVVGTLEMSRQLFKNGWKMFLYYVIAQESNLDNFVVFTDINELDKFRMTDPSTFVDGLLSDFPLIKMSGPELSAYIISFRQK
jgi:hypothetical protein